MQNKVELLAPAGDFSKLKTAFYFGADAVYIGSRGFSLRAMAEGFSDEEMAQAAQYAHKRGKKLYVAANIFARNADFVRAADYLKFISSIGADAVIISDPGLVELAAEIVPELPVHLSTQSNTLNKYAAAFWSKQGVKRIVLARELSLDEIKEVAQYTRKTLEIEVFAHGAMCISYSGRCLLSSYLSGRDGNRGACVQACRWNYRIQEKSRDGEWLDIGEDERGSYILNSKDLNMISHLDKLIGAGVCSLKIEGRMKSEYYLATVVNAYRRALDAFYSDEEAYRATDWNAELKKTVHRAFTTAYMLDAENLETVNRDDSQSRGDCEFSAVVIEGNEQRDYALIEMRNRFRRGDTLEVLSPTNSFNSKIVVDRLEDILGGEVTDAKLVQQRLKLYSDVKLHEGDILRLNKCVE